MGAVPPALAVRVRSVVLTTGLRTVSVAPPVVLRIVKPTSVVIPDSLTTLGDYAFYNCDSLTSVEIGDYVTSIGDYAFDDCDSLTSVEIGDSVTSIGSYAFSHCDSLTSVIIGNSVTSIGMSAFYNYTSLIIYCEAELKPDEWHDDWNYTNRPVVWGYKGE